MTTSEEGSQGPYSNLVKVGVWVAVALWAGLAGALIVALFQDATSGSEVAQSKDLIGPLVAGTGVLIAVLAFLRDRAKTASDRSEAKSKLLYEQAKSGLDDAFELLKDQNNDRITWVRAARVIARARALGATISNEEYRNAYRLAEEATRGRLYEALTIRGDEGERNALPPAFFFGHADWRTTRLTLDDLAIATSHGVRVYSVTRDHNVPDQPTKNLAGESVFIVMDFLTFPEDFDDPLRAVDKTSHDLWPDSWGAQQGAQRYLSHQQEFTALNGKLFPRTPRAADETAAP